MIDKIPKTRQIYFFMMPEETIRTIEFIIENNYIIFNNRSNDNCPQKIQVPDMIAQFYFCPSELEKHIIMYRLSENIYSLDATVSPVIEFEISRLYDKGLSRGRIYFKSGYVGRDAWISFPYSLFNAFNVVYKFLRNCFFTKNREYAAYISKSAHAYLVGGGHLMQI